MVAEQDGNELEDARNWMEMTVDLGQRRVPRLGPELRSGGDLPVPIISSILYPTIRRLKECVPEMIPEINIARKDFVLIVWS